MDFSSSSPRTSVMFVRCVKRSQKVRRGKTRLLFDRKNDLLRERVVKNNDESFGDDERRKQCRRSKNRRRRPLAVENIITLKKERERFVALYITRFGLDPHTPSSLQSDEASRKGTESPKRTLRDFASFRERVKEKEKRENNLTTND